MTEHSKTIGDLEAAIDEIHRLETRHNAIREATCCPSDCDMLTWAKALVGAWKRERQSNKEGK